MSFDSYLSVLSEKWREVPGGSDSGDRHFSDQFLAQANFLEIWEREKRAGDDIRGWYWRLYGDLLRGKRVLEIGSGMGFDAVQFAERGASWTACDIAESNLDLIAAVAKAKSLGIQTYPIRSLSSLRSLPLDFDVVWCNGSLINLPFDDAKEECEEILRHLKSNGRWIELTYPRERWVREGSPSFDQWGKMTDGERTPWMEWYDVEKLRKRLLPREFVTILDHRFGSNCFLWIDLQAVDDPGKEPGDARGGVKVRCDRPTITTPAALWGGDWSMPLGRDAQGRSVLVSIACVVTHGSVAFSLRRGDRFISREVIVDSVSGSQLFHLATDEFASDAGVYARNGSGLGESMATIESVTVCRR